MFENLFKGLFDTEATQLISLSDFLLCMAVALVLGFLMAFAYMFKAKYTKSFVITLALLPTVVCVVIMLVNGNIGTGVAIAGAFGLVRFRSAAGTAKEICAVFIAMGAGLVVGMGYIGYGILYTLIMCGVFMLYELFDFGVKRNNGIYKTFSITITEDLNYTNVFDDIFDEYTSEYELCRVKSTNMGSMFKLTYNVTLSNASLEKEMLDKLRCRNGNLEITVSPQSGNVSDL